MLLILFFRLPEMILMEEGVLWVRVDPLAASYRNISSWWACNDKEHSKSTGWSYLYEPPTALMTCLK